MSQLNNLTSLVKKRKTIGRGGSRGGTSGKGNKGQKARSGGFVRAGFEGGQMPLFRRLPKRGFNNYNFAKDVHTVNIQQLNDFFNDNDIVNKQSLLEKGLIDIKNGSLHEAQATVKILGHGSLSKKLKVYADAFSKNALKSIQDCGGEAHIA